MLKGSNPSSSGMILKLCVRIVLMCIVVPNNICDSDCK